MHGHVNIYHDARSSERQTETVCLFKNVCNELVIKTTQYYGTAETSSVNMSTANEMTLPSKKKLSDLYSSLLPLISSLFTHIQRKKMKRIKKCVNLLTSYKFVNFTQILTQQLYNAIYCLITF